MRKMCCVLISIMVVGSSLLAGCGGNSGGINCPFTELSWESTTEDMTALEGEEFDTYDSIYKGLTYTYPKEYLGNAGMIKYMYDDTGKLCNISWSYTGKDADDVMNVYNSVVEDMNRLFGEGKNDDGVGNYCEIWIVDAGTVMVNAVVTNDTYVMQVAYMSAEVSKQTQQ